MIEVIPLPGKASPAVTQQRRAKLAEAALLAQHLSGEILKRGGDPSQHEKLRRMAEDVRDLLDEALS
jgi:hypothetical protein